LANRPLRDGDRPRLFAIVVALLLVAAGLLAFFDDSSPSREQRRDPVPAASAGASTPTDAIVPAATPATLSEESDPPAELRPSPIDVARSKRAARHFLAGYLRFTYGRATVTEIRSATPELRTELARSRPRVPDAERRLLPRVELLQSNGVARQHANLVALVSDGKRRYGIRLQLANTPTGWLVTGLGG
jgi:hypothetical protein